ncbi:MAG: DUF6796 family protein [Pseudomonadota bacterium]
MSKAAIGLLVIGAAGSLIVAISDMIMVGQFISGRDAATSGLDILIGKTQAQLRLGAFLGLPGFLFQMAGFCSLLLLAKKGRGWAAIGIAVLFGLTLMVGSAWHMLYLPLGSTINQTDLPQETAEALQSVQIQHLVLAFQGWRYLFIASSTALVALLLTRSTQLPWWLALLSPYLLMIGARYTAGLLPAPIGGLLFVATVNVGLMIFFITAASVVLRRRQ